LCDLVGSSKRAKRDILRCRRWPVRPLEMLMRTLGFRIKTGFAVAVLLEQTDSGAAVVSRHEVPLAGASEASRFVYHAGLDVPQAQGEAAVQRGVAAVRRLSAESMQRLLDAAGDVEGAGVVVGSVTAPENIAGAHMRAHALEGKLYREVVIESLEENGVPSAILLERGAYEKVALAVSQSAAALRTEIAQLGAALKPWRSEEKLAALAAYWQLQPRS
jgi:hypothetical protein